MLTDQSGMPGSSASNNNKPFGIQQLFPGDLSQQKAPHYRNFHIDTSAHAITNTIGLFENLFQHKVRISPFFQLTEVEFHLL